MISRETFPSLEWKRIVMADGGDKGGRYALYVYECVQEKRLRKNTKHYTRSGQTMITLLVDGLPCADVGEAINLLAQRKMF